MCQSLPVDFCLKWASTITIQLRVLLSCKVDTVISISSNIACCHDKAEQFIMLALNRKHSLTFSILISVDKSALLPEDSVFSICIFTSQRFCLFFTFFCHLSLVVKLTCREWLSSFHKYIYAMERFLCGNKRLKLCLTDWCRYLQSVKFSRV